MKLTDYIGHLKIKIELYIIWTTLKRLEYGKAESKRIEKNLPTKYKSKKIRVAM